MDFETYAILNKKIKEAGGVPGKDGITPNIQIGTVTTLEPNQQATVENVGTKENPIFNFGIPKGEDGTGGGSGEKEWRLIKEIILEEDVSKINITTDSNDTPFNLSEVYFIFDYVSSDVAGELWINDCKTYINSKANKTTKCFVYMKNIGSYNIGLIRGEELSISYGSATRMFVFEGLTIDSLTLTTLKASTGSILKIYGR